MLSFLTFLAAYTLSQFYRSFLAVIAPELAQELALDPQALGNLQALWILGFVATQFPVGWALDTVGPRRTVALQMLAAVAGAFLFAAAQSPAALNAAMLLIGAGCGSIYMGALYVLGARRSLRASHCCARCSWGSARPAISRRPRPSASLRRRSAGAAPWPSWAWRPPFPRSPCSCWCEIRRALRQFGSRIFFRHCGCSEDSQPVALAADHRRLLRRGAGRAGLWAGPFFSSVYGLDPVARGHALLVMAAAMSAGAILYGPLDRMLGTRKWIVFGGASATALCFAVLGWATCRCGPPSL